MALDTRTIVKYQRALRTLMHLTLSSTSRKFVHLQRRTTIIDSLDRQKPPGESSTSSDDPDSFYDPKILSKLARAAFNKNDEKERMLRRGVTVHHPKSVALARELLSD